MNILNQENRFSKTVVSSLLFMVIICSCQRKQKFDKARWLEVGDLMTFPNRNNMIDDLVNNYNLKGKTFKEVTDLLGQPQYSSSSTMDVGYKIDEDYGSDIDPVYTKTLFIQFNKDTLVNDIKIRE